MESVFLCRFPQRSGGILDDGVDVKRGQIEHIPFIVDVVQRQQALRQLVQPFCLKQNDFQIFFLHFRRNRSV